MKQLLVFLMVILSVPVLAQDKSDGSDLKQYFMVILTKGPNRTQDSLTAQKIQKAHTDEAIHSGRLSYIIHPWLTQKGSVLR